MPSTLNNGARGPQTGCEDSNASSKSQLPPAIPRLQHLLPEQVDSSPCGGFDYSRNGSFNAPVSPSESEHFSIASASAAASTTTAGVQRSQSGGWLSGSCGGRVAASSGSASAAASDTASTTATDRVEGGSALQQSMEELRSAKAAAASQAAALLSGGASAGPSRQSSAPRIFEDFGHCGPEQEPSPTMRGLRDVSQDALSYTSQRLEEDLSLKAHDRAWHGLLGVAQANKSDGLLGDEGLLSCGAPAFGSHTIRLDHGFGSPAAQPPTPPPLSSVESIALAPITPASCCEKIGDGSLSCLVGRFGCPLDAERPVGPHTQNEQRSLSPLSTSADGSGHRMAQGSSGSNGISGSQLSRLPQPRARGRRDSGRGDSNDKDKLSALLAFKEQAAAVAVTHASLEAGGAGSAPEAAEVAAAASAVELRDLAELRSLRQPPAVVSQVVEALAAILGLSESGWVAQKKRLDSGLLQKLASFDDEATLLRVPQLRLERFDKALQAPAFKDDRLHKTCPAVAPLASWCLAVRRLLLALSGKANAAATGDSDGAEKWPKAGVPSLDQSSQVSRAASAVGVSDCLHQRSATTGTAGAGPGLRRETPHEICRSGSSSSVAQRALDTQSQLLDLAGLEVEPELWRMSEVDLTTVRNLRVSRKGVGCVTFDGETDCRGLLPQLRELLVIEQGEVVVYPDPCKKPPVGQGLNKAASVVLYGCMPKSQQKLLDPKARERYKQRVAQMTEEKGAVFEDYDCDDGTWRFRVNHF